MSSKLPRIDHTKLVRALEKAGFEKLRQRGSHLHLRHISDKKRVTVPIHSNRTIPPGTLKAILRDADLSVDDFLKLF